MSGRVLFVGDADTDLFIRLDHIPTWDEGVLARGKSMLPGGKGANSAVQFAGLGGKASLFCCVGDDSYAETAMQNFERSGLDTSLVVKNTGETTLCIMLLDDTGEKAIVVLPTDDIYPSEKYKEVLDSSNLDFCHVHMIGLNPEKVLWVAKWAKAKGLGVSVDLDSGNGGFARCGGLAGLADYVIMNKQGLANMTCGGTESIESRMKALQERIGGVLVCTLGAAGVACCDGKDFIMVPGKKVIPVDTTGSGDAFASGFLYKRVALDCELEEAVEFGNACGAFATRFVGGQGRILKVEDVEESGGIL